MNGRIPLAPKKDGQRFSVFGRMFLVRREGRLWAAYALGADGKRSPAGFVIPEFIEESELEQYLFDLFHESATPTNGDVRRIRETRRVRRTIERRPFQAMRLPFRLRLLLIALVISIGLCLVAAWLTSGSFDPRGGKSTFVAALIVVPLAVASKYGITGAAAMFLAFLFYWLASFALLAFPWRGRGSGH